MSILSVVAQNASLDNDYGSTRGPNTPGTHYVAFFQGNPDAGGVEINPIDCPGYVRAPINNDTGWLPATEGRKSTAALVAFPAVGGVWLQAPTHYQLFDHITDSSGGWDNGPLSAPLNVTSAGDGPRMDVTVFYPESSTIPAP